MKNLALHPLSVNSNNTMDIMKTSGENLGRVALLTSSEQATINGGMDSGPSPTPSFWYEAGYFMGYVVKRCVTLATEAN